MCLPFYWLLSIHEGSTESEGPRTQSARFSEHWKLPLLSAPSLAADTWEGCALIRTWRHFTWGRGKSEVYFCERFAGVKEARTVFNCSCPHVTYLKLLFPFKDIISSCHQVHFPRKANLLKRLKLYGAFPLMPEQLFLWLLVLPLPFLPEKSKHKYYKLILLATSETNDLRSLVLVLFLCVLAKLLMQNKLLPSFPVERETRTNPGRFFFQRYYCPCSHPPGTQSTIELGRGSGWKNGGVVEPLKQGVTGKLMAWSSGGL